MKASLNPASAVILYGKDILRSPEMTSEKQYIQHGGVSVYTHSLMVALTCARLKNTFFKGADMRSLIRGALLHDYFLYDWHDKDKIHKLHGFNHASTALYHASNDFSLNEKEKNMIHSHMFPLGLVLPKYKESFILYIADKLCAVKEFLKIK